MHRLILLCALALPTAVAADPPRPAGDEVERLARRLERDTREMREEVIVAFRGKEPFKDLEAHTREIERLAGAIREATEHRERQRFVRESLEKIDEHVRQVDREVNAIGRIRDIDRRAYDRVRDELSDMTRTLYRLRRELEPLRR
jgi:hypothetical protein